MTIGRKLILCFAGLMVVMLGLTYTSLTTIARLVADLDEVAQSEARKLDLTGQLLRDVTDMDASQRSIALAASLQSQAASERHKEGFNLASAKADADLAQIAPLLQSDSDRQHAEAARAALAAWRTGYQEFLRVCAGTKDPQVIAAFVDERLIPLMDREDEASAALAQTQREQMEESERSARSTSQRTRLIAFGMLGLVLLAGGITMAVIRRINGSLREVASGLAAEAAQAAGSSSQVAATSQVLAQGASEQGAALQETSASSMELNAQFRHFAEDTSRAAELAAGSEDQLAQVDQTLNAMVAAMEDLTASSDKISDIIRVIDGIAFQTNILALNAAVEAARAGQAGMGFAVVADEVRNLAQRSAEAARDTASMIEDSIDKSRQGKSRADEVTAAIHAVIERSGKIKLTMDEIHRGSQEQAARIEHIGGSINRVEHVTQQVAASAEESAGSAEELSAQSATLNATAGRLAAMVGGVEGLGGETTRRLP